MEGIDYSFGNGTTAAQMKNAGKGFVCRYLSGGGSKDIDKAELGNLLHAGLAVVLVWETSGTRMEGGSAAGHADAEKAHSQANDLGVGGIPIFFAADWDATPGQQGEINAYLDACAAVIGKARVGLYSGYYPMKRAFDAGKIKYGWQTFAWSGGLWDSRAHIHQYKNEVRLPGAPAAARFDLDRTTPAGVRDFGQWPRPK